MEKRSSRRVATGVGIGFSVERPDAARREYLGGLVGDFSLGGIFLVTDQPLNRGDLVRLNLTPVDEEPLEVVAVVRWTRRWMRPRGAGLEFIEFGGVGDREFAGLLERVFEPAD